MLNRSAEHVKWRQINRSLRLAGVVPFALLATFVLAAFLLAERLGDIIRWDRHSVEVLEAASELQQSFINFETGIRGYELTHDEAFLEPTRIASGLVTGQFANLTSLVGDNAAQVQRLGRTHDDFETWLSYSKVVEGIVRAGRTVDKALDAHGKFLMDRIRGDVGDFTANERILLTQRSQNVGPAERNAIILLSVLYLIVCASVLLWTRRQMGRLAMIYEKALGAEESERKRFQVTLASIGDAVVVTDRNGAVNFMNKEAERMTGWIEQDATGRPLNNVFRIVNEDSRKPVDDPVEKVFRELRVVGLANHTVLISKAGAEWMIEDSASPIFDERGEITGVVLVFQDATERRRAQKELLIARDEAVSASRAKDDFLATLSHELRTPLNPVLLLASEYANRDDLEESLRHDFETIAKNVLLEARLIDDLLDLTRITNRKLSLNLETVDAQSILRDSIGKVLDEIKTKRLEIVTLMDESPAWVVADRTRLEQVFWNILKNAVKFTQAGGRVSVRAVRSSEPMSVTFMITDTGMGMSPEELAKAFEPFAQGKHSERSSGFRFGGLGLGLAIARSIVEMHKGTISAASDGRGHGASFSVHLPSTQSPPAGEGEDHVIDDSRETSLGANPNYRILLVEDHEATSDALKAVLTKRGFEITVAENVLSALKAANEGRFDLVISDLGLPDGDGYELMRILRDRYGLRGIATSGYGMESDISRAKQAGFEVHLTKPVVLSRLESEILKGPWAKKSF